jgi:hypothetical protein
MCWCIILICVIISIFIEFSIQQMIKDSLNVMIEKSHQKDLQIISYNIIPEISDVTFLFNKQEMNKENSEGKDYITLTNDMIDKCDGYKFNKSELKDIRLKNCTVEIKTKTQETDSFKFYYIHLNKAESPNNFLNYIEYPYNNYKTNIENFFVFPNYLKPLFTIEECVSSFCQNVTESITLHDEYNFRIVIQPEEILDKYEFILQRVMLTSYDKNTNELFYAREVTNIIKVINSTFSLPIENLPENFDLQMNYLIKAKPGNIIVGDNDKFKVRIFLNYTSK